MKPTSEELSNLPWRKLEYEVKEAENGEEAIKEIQNGDNPIRVDTIVCDI